LSFIMRDDTLPVALIGPGRIGQALGKLLSRAGVRIEWIAARRLSAARSAARFIGSGRAVPLPVVVQASSLPVVVHASQRAARQDARTTTGIADLNAARILLLTTSDSALPEVARLLAAQRKDWDECIVLHTSGAWPAGGESSVLQPFRRGGASAASLHPLQTVPSREAGVRNLFGCFWAVEGDPTAVGLARRWVRLLHGHALTITPRRKPAYHAAAVIACAGVVTLMESAERLMSLSGVERSQARKMLAGFVSESAANFGRLGGRRSLTGPASRGDWATIRKHQAALRREAPDLVPLYRELLRSMLKLAGQQPRRDL
jgi:predicted short-subunit dehydrogenase-like oxidoreductase (DUF2520 family)